MNYSIVIPARYQSTRLPGKPLVDIAGKPMIVRTWEQCVKASDTSRVYVATDDERVKAVCEEWAIQVLITSDRCLTGTDRVAESIEQIESDVCINVQGDEPIFNPDDIRLLIKEAEKNPEVVLNGYSALDNEEQFFSPQVPKVVFDKNGYLLYMSRGAIPSNKKGSYSRGWRQVCAYSFPRKALFAFSSEKEKTPLEAIEDIEILRFLEMGIQVKMLEMSNVSIPVDNREDVERVEQRIAGNMQ